MKTFVVTIWNGEDYDDSQTDTLLVAAKDSDDAKAKIQKIIDTESALYRVDARENDGQGVGVWQIIESGYFYRGKVTGAEPLELELAKTEQYIAKAEELKKRFLVKEGMQQ